MAFIAIATAFIFSALWIGHDAIQCHICDSITDSRCGDNFLTNHQGFVHDCKIDPSTVDTVWDHSYAKTQPWKNDGGCSKEKLTGKMLGHQLKVVARFCGNFHSPHEFCPPRGHPSGQYGWDDETVWLCSCTGELCNGSNILRFSPFILMTLPALLLYEAP